MSPSAVENNFVQSGNTVFIRPPRNGLLHDRISETSLIRKSAIMPPPEKTLPPISWPDLAQMPPRTLLKILGDARKSAALTVHSAPNLGLIYLRKGKICFACVTPSFAPISTHKAFHRILMWKTGSLKLEWGEPPYQSDEVCEDIVPLLDENAMRTEELGTFENMFPPRTHLKICALPENINRLHPAELDVLQMAMEGRSIQDILDAHPFSDLEVYRTVLALAKAGYISGASQSGMELSRAC